MICPCPRPLPQLAFAVLVVLSFSNLAQAVSNQMGTMFENGKILTALVDEPAQYFGGNNTSSYMQWVASAASYYSSSIFLASSYDPTDGAAVHWKIVPANTAGNSVTSVDLAVAVRATGWCGFGFSTNGGMTGSDVFLFEAARPTVVSDAFITDIRYPQIDTCQDWTFVNSTITSDFIIVQVRRALNTSDTAQDLVLFNDTSFTIPEQRVISAWGDSPMVSYHGQRRARGAIRFFDKEADANVIFEDTIAKQADGSFQLLAHNYSLLPIVTDYEYRCLTGNDLRAQNVPVDQGVTIIGFAPIITNPHVHHFTVSASYSENNGANCTGMTYYDMIYAWAPGEPPFLLPDFLGISLGAQNGFKSFMINYHYDNPDLLTGLVDNSGMAFYYSNTSRQYDMGVLQLGDPYVHLYGQPVGQGTTEHSFNCSAACSAAAFAVVNNSSPSVSLQQEGSSSGGGAAAAISSLLTSGVTVFKEALHMHESGISMINSQYRNGQLFRSGKAEYFSFTQQGAQEIVQEPFQIMAGDAFQTKCFYYNNASSGERVFGLGSSDEMCIAFLYYYPRMSLGGTGAPWVCGYTIPFYEGCNATYEHHAVINMSELGRDFGQPPETCPAPLSGGNSNGTWNLSVGNPVGDSSTSAAIAPPQLGSASALMWMAAIVYVLKPAF